MLSVLSFSALTYWRYHFCPHYQVYSPPCSTRNCSLTMSSILYKHTVILTGHIALHKAQFSDFNVTLVFQLFEFMLNLIPILVKAGFPSILFAFLLNYPVTLLIFTILSPTPSLSCTQQPKKFFFSLSLFLK